MPNSTIINSQTNKETPSVGLGNNKKDLATLLDIQHRIAKETKHSSMSYCARYAIRLPWDTPAIKGVNGKVRVTGTQLCRSKLCPLCSRIHSDKEAKEIERIISYLAPLGWSLYFVTFTKSTILNIGKSYKVNKEGVNKMRAYFKNQKANHGVEVIRYTIFEETYSNEPVKCGKGEHATYITTAHSHAHSLFGFPPSATKKDRERMLQGVSRTWKDVMIKHGSRVSKDGVQVKLIDTEVFTHTKVSQYLSGIITDKTNIHKELAYSQNKVSKGRSFAQLMIDIDEKGLPCDLKAYKDTLNTYYRKQRSFKSQNWKKYLELATKYHDTRMNTLARHYIDNLLMNEDYIERLLKRSATEYSMIESIETDTQRDREPITYEIEFSHDLWEYLSKSPGTVPRLIKGVSIASSGTSVPISIQAIQDFSYTRPNYNNDKMKKDDVVDALIDLLHEEIHLK